MMRRFSVKNRKRQESCTAHFLVETATLRRYACMGDRSVLSATGVYPVLTVAPTDAEGEVLVILRDHAERFNCYYRQAVEAFLEWCMGEVAETVKKEYTAMGEKAAYCFRRRELLCNMTTDCSEVTIDLVRLGSTTRYWTRRGQHRLLSVSVRVSRGISRSTDAECFFEMQEIWRLPDVTIEGRARSMRATRHHANVE